MKFSKTYTLREIAQLIEVEFIGELKSWSLDKTAETTDSTVMGDGWRSRKTTLKSWSGQAEAFWDPNSVGQVSLEEGNSVTLTLFPTGNISGATTFEGEAIVTSVSQSASLDGMVEATFGFEGVGELDTDTVV